jgi:S1-C subfamily serine protease
MASSCPQCGSTNTKKLLLTKRLFQVSYPRRCRDCGIEWEPSASKAFLSFGLVLGATVLIPSLLAVNIIGICIGVAVLVVCGKRLAADHSATSQELVVEGSRNSSAPSPGVVQTAQTQVCRDESDSVGLSAPKAGTHRALSKKAIAGFFLILIGIVTLGGGIGIPLILGGLAFAYSARRDFRREGDRYAGRGWLIASWLLAGLALAAVLFSLLLKGVSGLPNTEKSRKTPSSGEAIQSGARSEPSTFSANGFDDSLPVATAGLELDHNVVGDQYAYSYSVPDDWKVRHSTGQFDSRAISSQGLFVGVQLQPNASRRTSLELYKNILSGVATDAEAITEPEWVQQGGQNWVAFSLKTKGKRGPGIAAFYLLCNEEWQITFVCRSKEPPYEHATQLFSRIFQTFQLPHEDKGKTNEGTITEGFYGTGTGFFISPDGYLATCYHVIEGANLILVPTSSGEKSARVVAFNKPADTALLKVDSVEHPLPLADSEDVRLGSWIATLGYPNVEVQGLEPKFAQGDIASLAGVLDDPFEFQINIPLQFGISGAPIVNRSGNVIAVASSRLSPDATSPPISYATKSWALRELIRITPEEVELVPVGKTQQTTEDVAEMLRRSVVPIFVE